MAEIANIYFSEFWSLGTPGSRHQQDLHNILIKNINLWKSVKEKEKDFEIF